jgi:hypothetical protein
MTETPQDIERFAYVQLEAAQKNIDECEEREQIAYEAHIEAILATLDAWERDLNARRAWHEAARAALAKNEESAP